VTLAVPLEPRRKIELMLARSAAVDPTDNMAVERLAPALSTLRQRADLSTIISLSSCGGHELGRSDDTRSD